MSRQARSQILVGIEPNEIKVERFGVALVCAEIHRQLQCESELPGQAPDGSPAGQAHSYLSFKLSQFRLDTPTDSSAWDQMRIVYLEGDLIPMIMNQAQHWLPKEILALGQQEATILNGDLLTIPRSQQSNLEALFITAGYSLLIDSNLMRAAQGFEILEQDQIQSLYQNLPAAQQLEAEHWLRTWTELS